MAIIQSAKKAIRSSARKRAFNTVRKNAVSNSVKQLKKLIKENKIKEARAYFPTVQQAFDKAVKTNYLKANTASRKKSRLSALIKRSAVAAK